MPIRESDCFSTSYVTNKSDAFNQIRAIEESLIQAVYKLHPAETVYVNIRVSANDNGDVLLELNTKM